MTKYLTYICLLFSIFFISFGEVKALTFSNGENSFYVERVFADEENESEAEVPATCEGVLGDKSRKDSIAYLLQEIFDIMKIAAPVLVLVFSILDFIGAVTSQDKDRLTKAVKHTFIRVIVGLIVFVVPFLCDFIFNLTGMYSTCGIG